ncbi:MAG: transglycosylase domain-containing protein [Mangrovibacterium sp.]
MTKTKSKPRYTKYIIAFWSLFAIGVFFVILFFSLIAKGKLGYMPSFEELENPRNLVASQVISRDGVVLGRYFRENRIVADYDDLPQSLIDALVATEDARYYDHSGIDLRGLFRVVKGIVTGDSSSGGGSTISQQLAKMLFPREPNASTLDLVLRKFKEWVIAVRLEKSYTKEEIITMYLNKYDFLNLAVGINSASRIYFSCEPKDLTTEQSAMLVGMAKNSALFNPLRREELTKERRNVVLAQMTKYNYLCTQERDSLQQLPLELNFSREDFKEGLAPYFREYLRLTLGAKKPERSNYGSWQTEEFHQDSIAWISNPLYGWCNKNIKEDGSHYNLYTDGLRIYTTIDSRMQQYAEEAVTEHLQTYLQPAFENHKKNLRNPPFSNDMSTEEVNNLLHNVMRQSERYRVLKRVMKVSDKEIEANFNTPTKMSVFNWASTKSSHSLDTIMTPMDSIRYTLGVLRSAMMSMDVKSGQVRAYVGGPDYRHFMYDMVTKGKRQVGSTVKPFLYTLAMQNGYSPCTMVPNVAQQFLLPDGRVWTPKNAGASEYDGKMVSLRWGLAHSVNYISAWVMKQYNPQAMKNIMEKLGITSPIVAVPSMFLGTDDISIYEMVGAYGVFGNQGVYTKPYFVTKIADRYGNTIASFQPERKDAIDENTAYLMISLLQNVVNEGSGIRLKIGKYAQTYDPKTRSVTNLSEYKPFTGEIGGKTGTTQNQSDGWFMGETPQLVTGIWTGGEVRSIRFPSLTYGQGARMAMPVFGRFLRKVYDDPTLEYKDDCSFEKPKRFNISLDCDEPNIKKQSDNNNASDFEDFF